jgi:hypothetical protein
MEREFSAALHPTQFGNHIKDSRHRATHINPEVAKLVEQGYNVRKAYRMVAHAKAENKVKQEFDYDKETPKGEWV